MTGIDTTVPHSARIWNYWLGGTDNYAVDREAGDQYKEIFPGIAVVARTSRAWLSGRIPKPRTRSRPRSIPTAESGASRSGVTAGWKAGRGRYEGHHSPKPGGAALARCRSSSLVSGVTHTHRVVRAAAR
jgi:S-adenosyl methyltransferase